MPRLSREVLICVWCWRWSVLDASGLDALRPVENGESRLADKRHNGKSTCGVFLIPLFSHGKDERFVHLPFLVCASTFPFFAHPIAIDTFRASNPVGGPRAKESVKRRALNKR